MHPCALTRGVAAAWPLRAATARPRTITRAFSPRSSPPRPALPSTPAPDSQQQSFPLLHLLGPLSIVSIAAALPVFAQEAAISNEQLTSTAATAIYDETTGSTDIMVTIIFTTVVALLTIVTAGVIYLGVAQALDKKQEMDSQQALKAKLKTVPYNGSGSPDSKVPAAFRTKDKRDKAKGFGDS